MNKELLLFISDLHLCESRPELTNGFKAFLKNSAGKADALFILGDLFESWIGDDDLSEFNQDIIHQLKTASDAGTKLYFLAGNRDFLIGKEFSQMTGCTLLGEEYIVEHAGHKALLMHGDSLCLADTEYQNVRKMVRSRPWQDEVLSKTLTERRAMAKEVMNQSSMHKSNLAENIMDVTDLEVTRLMEKYSVDLMIHGHTHRPDTHKHSLNNTNGDISFGKRMVLGDWNDKGWVIEWDENPPRLCSFPLQD